MMDLKSVIYQEWQRIRVCLYLKAAKSLWPLLNNVAYLAKVNHMFYSKVDTTTLFDWYEPKNKTFLEKHFLIDFDRYLNHPRVKAAK